MEKQIKIFAYIGSCNPQSTTEMIVSKLIDKTALLLKEKVQCVIRLGKDTDIADCVGCLNCFISGSCMTDRKDEMGQIRKEMMDADCIILGSPVFFHDVSGNMKRFIDRISYWTHTMELTGKIGYTVATSGGNGMEFVSNYLNKLMEYLGIVRVGKYEKATYSRSFVDETELMTVIDRELDTEAELLAAYLSGEKAIVPSQRQKDIFRSYNDRYRKMDYCKGKLVEVDRWYNRGYLQCKSFEEAIAKRRG